MRQIHEFRSNFENISRDNRETFVRVSHDVSTNVAYFHSYNSRETFMSVTRHSYECRLVLFSRQIVARCSHVFSRLLRDRPATLMTFVRVSQKFGIVNLLKFRGDRLATLARPSRDSLGKYFGKKNCI